MLCPEVWSFKAPPYSVSTKSCETEEEIFRSIKNQYFNHHVSITLPDTLQLPRELTTSLLEDSQYYRINNVCAAELLKKEFLDLFVRKGRLTAISLNRLSELNSLAITPCGKFILSMSQNIFQKLGIQEAFIENPKSCMKKFFLNVDLTCGSKEAIKKCELVHKKLSLQKNFCFDLVLAWEPDFPEICPSSIAYYFSTKGHFVKACEVQCKEKLRYNVSVPVYDEKTEIPELVEWLGAFTLDCKFSYNESISTLKCPENNQVFGQVLQIAFTGLLTQSRVKNIISRIRELEHSRTWISISVLTFQSSALNIKKNNFIFSQGDCNYILFFKKNHPALLYMFQDRAVT